MKKDLRTDEPTFASASVSSISDEDLTMINEIAKQQMTMNPQASYKSYNKSKRGGLTGRFPNDIQVGPDDVSIVNLIERVNTLETQIKEQNDKWHMIMNKLLEQTNGD